MKGMKSTGSFNEPGSQCAEREYDENIMPWAGRDNFEGAYIKQAENFVDRVPEPLCGFAQHTVPETRYHSVCWSR